MKFGNLLFGVLAVSMFAGNAAAANKIRLMDMQGSGKSRFDVSLALSQGSGESRQTYLGTTTNYNDKSSYNRLVLGYVYGLTDRFDVSLSLPLAGNSKYSSEYNTGGNQYKYTWQQDGAGDVSLTANYQLMNKQANGLNWNLAGSFSPSTASSTSATAERSVNGVVTVAGTKGKNRRGFTEIGISTAVGLPTSIGDVVVDARIFSGGEETEAGVKTKHGSSKDLNIYLESAINSTTTLTPYVGYFSSGSITSAGSTSPSATYYSAGLMATVDVSNRVSLRGSLGYSRTKEYSTAYSGGSTVNTYSSYGVGLSSMFFF